MKGSFERPTLGGSCCLLRCLHCQYLLSQTHCMFTIVGKGKMALKEIERTKHVLKIVTVSSHMPAALYAFSTCATPASSAATMPAYTRRVGSTISGKLLFYQAQQVVSGTPAFNSFTKRDACFHRLLLTTSVPGTPELIGSSYGLWTLWKAKYLLGQQHYFLSETIVPKLRRNPATKSL